jgi:hypothetical protein
MDRIGRTFEVHAEPAFVSEAGSPRNIDEATRPA